MQWSTPRVGSPSNTMDQTKPHTSRRNYGIRKRRIKADMVGGCTKREFNGTSEEINAVTDRAIEWLDSLEVDIQIIMTLTIQTSP